MLLSGGHTFHAAIVPSVDFPDLSPSVHHHFHYINPQDGSKMKFIQEDGTLKDTCSLSESLVDFQRFLLHLKINMRGITLVFYSFVELCTFVKTASSICGKPKKTFLQIFLDNLNYWILCEFQNSKILQTLKPKRKPLRSYLPLPGIVIHAEESCVFCCIPWNSKRTSIRQHWLYQ